MLWYLLSLIFGGGLITTVTSAIQRFRHIPLDWLAMAGTFTVSVIGLGVVTLVASRPHRPGPEVLAPSGKPQIFVFPASIAFTLIYARKVGLINVQFLSTDQVKLTYVHFDFRGRTPSGGSYLHSCDDSDPTTLLKGTPTPKVIEAKLTESEMLDFAVGAPVSITGYAKVDYGHATDSLHVDINIQTVPLWGGPGFPIPADTAKELTADDPKVLIEYEWRSSVPDRKDKPICLRNDGGGTALNVRINRIEVDAWTATFPLIPSIAPTKSESVTASVHYAGLQNYGMEGSLVSVFRPPGGGGMGELKTTSLTYTYSNANGNSFEGVYEFRWDGGTMERAAFFVRLTKRRTSPSSSC